MGTWGGCRAPEIPTFVSLAHKKTTLVKMKSNSISQRIENARLLITGALRQPIVRQEVAKLGYPLKEIQKGEKLLNKVVLLQTAKKSKYGSQLSASEQCKQDQAAAWETYMYHVKSAKLTFRHDIGTMKRLQLDGPRKVRFAAWMEQSRYFYQEIRQMTEHFAVMGVTADELAQAQAMMEAVADAKRHCKSLAGEAQLATQERNAALKELDAWVSKFTKVARIALNEHDQLLEGMGLLVRSRA